MSKANDPVEEFLAYCDETTFLGEEQTNKLIALVRIYREANREFIEVGKEKVDINTMLLFTPAYSKACAAEEKAQELIK